MTTHYKTWFKRIRSTLALKRYDVVEIMALGGNPVSASRADGWERHDSDLSRSTKMTEAEFDAFTRGLVEWKRKKRAEHEARLDISDMVNKLDQEGKLHELGLVSEAKNEQT